LSAYQPIETSFDFIPSSLDFLVDQRMFYNPQGGANPVPINPQQGQGYYNAPAGNQGQYGNGGNGGNQSPVPDYLRHVTPEAMNIGISIGQDMLNKQRDKWMPGLSGFWHSLKYYFLVSLLLSAD
jgi:hypothetical protein